MYLLWQVDGEQTCDPLKGNQIKTEGYIVKMVAQFWQSLPHVVLQNFLINKYANHVAVVIQRQVRLHNLGHRPECFLLFHAGEESSCDEIHALAVSDGWITIDYCEKYVP